MLRYFIYVDSSVVGGCEDPEFSTDSRALWDKFIHGQHMLALSRHTIRELEKAPESVRGHLLRMPEKNQRILEDSDESRELAQAYVEHGIVGEGSRADALHVALATVAGVDVLVSWNFKHIVNLGRIRLFNSANIKNGYRAIEIRTPKEVMDDEKDI